MDLLFPIDDNLSLRLLEPRHADEVFAVIHANREHIGRRLPWVEKTPTPEELRQFAKGSVERYAKGVDINLSIMERGRVVGGIGLNGITKSDVLVQIAQAEIGYWLAADAQGRGLVTRSSAALLDHAFDVLGLFRVIIRTEPDNPRSRAVPQRLGFTLEGTQRHVCRWNGRWVDHCLYAMLAEDWRAVKGR